MYKSLHAQDEDLHLNVGGVFCMCCTHFTIIFHFSTNRIIDLWRHYVHGMVASMTLEWQQKHYQIITFDTTIQSPGLDYRFSWALFDAAKYFGKISNHRNGNRCFKEIFTHSIII